MADDNKKKYTSLPTPVRLDAPDHPEGYEPPKRVRGRAEMPEFDNVPIGMPGRVKEKAPDDKGLGVFRAAQKDYGANHEREPERDETQRRMPPPPPQIRPGDMPRKRKKPPAPEREDRVRKQPNRFLLILGKILFYRINPLYVSIAGWGIAGFAAVGIIIWFGMSLFVDNSFAVYLDDELIGHIPITDDLTSESFHEYAVLSLEASRGGVRVNVEQTVTIEPARVSSSQVGRRSDVLGLLTRKFDYTIAATAIYVNGNFEALMRTQACLDHLKQELFTRWQSDPNEEMINAEFIGEWEEIVRYVDPDPEVTEFTDARQAFNRLDRPTMQMYPYTVVRGDNLGSIAVRYGTDINRIMRDNDLKGTNIFPGEVLQIYTSRPLLSVRTYNEIRTEESIPMPIDPIENPDLPNHITRVVQYGAPGLKVTRELVIRENGVERSRETLESETITEPVIHIIEQGTGSGSLVIR
ncbi:MAG: G5 domain-containing protein [Defluviitaleaceae bacterium]|nr:G5 domain-containing protein [Defluviitaleaceae bacterium]